jgi:MFS family permease
VRAATVLAQRLRSLVEKGRMAEKGASRALRFVVLVGVMSFFADFTYEGARAVTGPFLALLGAGGATVAIVAGLGELLGYALRLVSGRAADRTRRYWPIAIAGYVVQMASVPALALAPSWHLAALLIILERVGKATRNPPRDVMLSYAGKQMGGYGWAFGLHEALDQAGALLGPLAMAAILALRHDYRLAFAALLVPALATLALVVVARLLFPQPERLEPEAPAASAGPGLPRVFWIYLGGAALVGAGFVDYPLVAFHFQRARTVDGAFIPVFYAVAMGTGGAGSLVFGRLFDRLGLRVLLPLTIVTALFAPLVFFGGFWAALAGAALWGLGMGVHESLIPAAVAPMVPPARRASAYGIFTAGYGVAWFAGSVVIGLLYNVSVTAAVVASLLFALAALPLLAIAARR